MFFPSEASINRVRVSGPEAVSSVKIGAFQWPLGAAVVRCLARDRVSAVPTGRGWSLGRDAIMFSCGIVTSLNYLLTGWLEFVFAQIYCRCVAEQMVCLPLERTGAIFSAHCMCLFFPKYMYKSNL